MGKLRLRKGGQPPKVTHASSDRRCQGSSLVPSPAYAPLLLSTLPQGLSGEQHLPSGWPPTGTCPRSRACAYHPSSWGQKERPARSREETLVKSRGEPL